MTPPTSGPHLPSSATTGKPHARLRAEAVTLGYTDVPVTTDLSIAIPDRAFTAIIGPNACGKSTLLRALARLMRPTSGRVLLDETDLHTLRPRDAARSIGLLPQTAIAPEGITVQTLVGRGRYPHQALMRRWSTTDTDAVDRAMAATGVTDLAYRDVTHLSGGQRQRVWAAMAIAQEPDVLLLDEPTTYLDIAHQIELLDVFSRINESGTTIVAVLHELGQAARYADHLIVMKAGEVVTQGHPGDVLTAELVEHVYDLPCQVIPDPVSGAPLVIPTAGHWRRGQTPRSAGGTGPS